MTSDGKSLREEADRSFAANTVIGAVMCAASVAFLFLHPTRGVVLMGIAFGFLATKLLMDSVIVVPLAKAKILGGRTARRRAGDQQAARW